jgi:toxin ParE1/3/4
MGNQVVLTRQASDDLIEIARHIAQDDPALADSFANDLIDQTTPLSDFPQMGRTVPELKRPAVRELIRSPYRIIYRVQEGNIQILRFWHAARGIPRL